MMRKTMSVNTNVKYLKKPTITGFLFHSVLIFLFLMTGARLLAAGPGYGVISDPGHNASETDFVKLEKSGDVNADLGDGEFLFRPYSLTVDNDGNLFIFDDLQGKIFKLDKHGKMVKSFGGKGRGPGMIPCDNKYCSAYMNIGLDGKLYVNVGFARAVMVFNRDGNFLKSIPVNEFILKPHADKNGNLLFPSMDDSLVTISNQDKKVLMQTAAREFITRFLFLLPGSEYLKATTRVKAALLTVSYYDGSRLVLYVKAPSKFMVFENNKLVKTVNARPKQALENAKRIFTRKYKKNTNCYRPVFTHTFSDVSGSRAMYMYHGGMTHGNKKISALYEYSPDGKLQRVLYIDQGNGKRTAPRFCCKYKDTYYIINNGKIEMYKEVTTR